MIRKAERKDIPKILELLDEIHELHYKGRNDLFKANVSKFDEVEIYQMMNNPRTPIYVYDDNGVILGYIFLRFAQVSNKMFEPIKYIFIEDLCIDEKYRGKNIGTLLIDYTYEIAKIKSYDYIRLNVWSFNNQAYDFYLKNGFEPLEVVMEKKIK